MCLYAYNKQTVLSITACVAAPRCEKRFSSIATVHCCPRTWLLARRKYPENIPCAGPLFEADSEAGRLCLDFCRTVVQPLVLLLSPLPFLSCSIETNSCIDPFSPCLIIAAVIINQIVLLPWYSTRSRYVSFGRELLVKQLHSKVENCLLSLARSSASISDQSDFVLTQYWPGYQP